MLEWLQISGANNVYVGAALALVVLLGVRYMDSQQAAAHAKALAESRERQEKAKAAKAAIKRRYYTLDELKEFTGEDNKPIYIGVLDEIYDVSAKRDFYGPGEGYHLFAGRDASRALAKMSFEPEDLNSDELKDLGFMDQETLQDWVMKFSLYNGYPNVGRVLRKRDLTVAELRPFNGVDNERKIIYVAINGNIYDVTLDGAAHYGPEGGYKQFAGRDASRALACMSFNDDFLDNPTLEDITDAQRKTLAEWEAKFVSKYPVVGKLLQA